MINSNEPGYSSADRYGIRTENLVVVEPRAVPGAEREMFGFETISLAPIDANLIDPRLLDEEEVAWLDAYHAKVRATVSPHVNRKTRSWLVQATRRLASK